VAGHTLAPADDLVGTLCLRRHQSVVTAEADLCVICCQQHAMVGRMRIVTTAAVPLSQWCMDEFFAHGLLEIFMARQAKLSSRPGSKVIRVGRLHRAVHGQGQSDSEAEKHQSMSSHGYWSPFTVRSRDRVRRIVQRKAHASRL